MDLDKETLDKLIELMQRDGLDRLHVRVEGMDVDLRMSSLYAPAAAPVRAPQEDSDAAGQGRGQVAKSESPPNVRKVLAPLVGVFYRSPAPGAKPFVELGDRVNLGQTLCILEAMKLMNEITSEHDGKVVRIIPKDGELTTLHQELFWIET